MSKFDSRNYSTVEQLQYIKEYSMVVVDCSVLPRLFKSKREMNKHCQEAQKVARAY
jgi:hypothetical protein